MSEEQEVVKATTLATAHIPELDLDILVSIWSDGSGEVAHRPGHGLTGITWSIPTPLEMAQ